MIDPLINSIRNRQAVLFVGAGVSRNLGLPSWGELIAEMARLLDYDPEIFDGFGTNWELAEYYKLKKTTMGSLRSWMDRKWHADESIVDSSKVHQAIINLGFPIIYTTNYDRWLEIAFSRAKKDYVKIANIGDFTNVRASATQIVKLHGDFEDDNSLVLTETSYFERMAFESPLDLKLRYDTIGNTFLFIGYSHSDMNVRYLLHKLHKMWSDSDYAPSRPKSYLLLSRPNPVQEAILEARGVTPVVLDNDDPGEGLSDFLERLLHQAFGITL